MATDSVAVLVGLVVTVAVVGLAGGIGLTILICVKWKQYVKLRNETRIHPSNRNGRRRSRRIRVRDANGENQHQGPPAVFEPPPPYSEVDTNPLPPYTPMGLLVPNRPNNTRGSNGTMTPMSYTRTPQVSRHQLTRNPHFSNIGTGTTNTPMVTPSISMMTSSVAGTRDPSASSNVRSTAMKRAVYERMAYMGMC